MIGTTITSIATVLSFIFVTRLLADGLGPEGFGSYSLARRIIATLEPLSTFNMGIAISRFTAIDRKKGHGYLFSGLLFGLCSSTVLLGLAFIFRGQLTHLFFQNENYMTLLLFTFILILGYSCFVILYGFYRGMGKIWQANIWQLALIAIVPLIIAKKYAYSATADTIMLIYAFSFAAVIIPISYYLVRSFKVNGMRIIKVSYIKELFNYGFFRIPGFFVYAGILSIAIFLSPHFGTLKSAGYIAIGLAVLKVTEGGIDSFGRVILPRASQFFASGKTVFLKERIKDMVNFIFHIGLYTTLHIMLWSDIIVPIWLGAQYKEAISTVNIFAVSITPFLAYSMLRVIVDAIEVRAINARNIYISFGVTMIACLIFAVSGLGVTGLALGTAMGIFTLGALTLRYLCINFRITSFDARIKECLFLNLALIAACYMIKKFIIMGMDRGGMGTLAAMAIVEAALFALYCLVLDLLNVRWIKEVKRRILVGESLPA